MNKTTPPLLPSGRALPLDQLMHCGTPKRARAFIPSGLWVTMPAERDVGGKVVAVVLHQNGRDMRARRMPTQ
jgi:hypothetical protein